MTKLQPIIAVHDVAKSSNWYQTLLGLKSNHGGDKFEILVEQEGTVVLCLHKWEEHSHPTMTNPEIPADNGLILYFRVDDLDQAWKNAIKLNATVEEEPHTSKNSHQMEFAIRDLDGYFLLISK